MQSCGSAGAHGHGLAARTSWNRAGYRATPSRRASRISPSSNGVRNASSALVPISAHSSRNSTPRCARLTAPGRAIPVPPPTSAATLEVWCGATNGGRVISGVSPRQHPGHRVDGGDLERLAVGQRRQQSRKPLGQHRFPDSRAGRSTSDGVPRRRPPRRRTAPGTAPRRRRDRRQRSSSGRRRVDPLRKPARPVEPALQLAQRRHTEHLDAVDQAGLGQVLQRHHHGRPALPLGRQHRGKTPAHRPHPAVERQFAQQHASFRAAARASCCPPKAPPRPARCRTPTPSWAASPATAPASAATSATDCRCW